MLQSHNFNKDRAARQAAVEVPAAVIAVVERCIDQGLYQKLLRVTLELNDPDLIGVQRGRALTEQTTLQCKMRNFAMDAGIENNEFGKLCKAEIRLRMQRAGRPDVGTRREAEAYRTRAMAVQSAERLVASCRRQLEVAERRLAEAQEQKRSFNEAGKGQ